MHSDDIVWFLFSCLLDNLSLCYSLTRTYFQGYCIQYFILRQTEKQCKAMMMKFHCQVNVLLAFYASPANSRRQTVKGIVFSGLLSGRPLSLCPLTRISHGAISLYLVERYIEACHRYSTCEWEFLKKVTRSQVKNQGYAATVMEIL